VRHHQNHDKQYGRGYRGQRARAAGDQHAAASRRVVERADAGNEGAAIGQIDVMRASLDGGLGNMIGLALERTRSVNHEVGTPRCQRRGKILRVVIDRNGLAGRRRRAKLADKAGSARRVSSRNAEPDFFFGGEGATNPAAKVPVAAENDDPKGHRDSILP
jgi:hypothetical protein